MRSLCNYGLVCRRHRLQISVPSALDPLSKINWLILPVFRLVLCWVMAAAEPFSENNVHTRKKLGLKLVFVNVLIWVRKWVKGVPFGCHSGSKTGQKPTSYALSDSFQDSDKIPFKAKFYRVWTLFSENGSERALTQHKACQCVRRAPCSASMVSCSESRRGFPARELSCKGVMKKHHTLLISNQCLSVFCC